MNSPAPVHPPVQPPVQPLPQDVRLGLAGFAPSLRSAAEAALREAAGAAIDNPALWSSSGLTGDRFPLELSFTTGDDALRWTFDPAAHLRLDQRRAVVLAALKRLGWRADRRVLARALTGAGADDFGAWLGGRHSAEGDAYKLYLDWGDGPEAQVALAALGLPAPRHAGPVETPMLALGPGETRCEVYHRLSPPPEALANLLAPAGLAHRAPALREAIAAEYGHAIRGRLPGGRIGVSYVVENGQIAPAATLFFFARILWGGDARIRARMIAHLEAAGRDPSAYEAATRPLILRNTAETRHGMVALTVTEGDLIWGVGLRPAATP